MTYPGIKRVPEDLTQGLGEPLGLAGLRGVQDGALDAPGQSFAHQLCGELYSPGVAKGRGIEISIKLTINLNDNIFNHKHWHVFYCCNYLVVNSY